MGKKKLKQYADIQDFDNVFEFDDPKINSVQNNWSEFFKNEKPLILELGCGKGDYTINLAKENQFNWAGHRKRRLGKAFPGFSATVRVGK